MNFSLPLCEAPCTIVGLTPAAGAAIDSVAGLQQRSRGIECTPHGEAVALFVASREHNVRTRNLNLHLSALQAIGIQTGAANEVPARVRTNHDCHREWRSIGVFRKECTGPRPPDIDCGLRGCD